MPALLRSAPVVCCCLLPPGLPLPLAAPPVTAGARSPAGAGSRARQECRGEGNPQPVPSRKDEPVG